MPWPREQKVAAVGERAREAFAARTQDDGDSSYLGSILVRSDGIALFLFEAASIGAATALAQQAGIA